MKNTIKDHFNLTLNSMNPKTTYQGRYRSISRAILIRAKVCLFVAVLLSALSAEAHIMAAAGSPEKGQSVADKTVRGKIIDTSNDQGLPGVNVVVKGTSRVPLPTNGEIIRSTWPTIPR